MHELPTFLVKNWLAVGVAAIVFFLIGLLLAKFIWGRYATRLSSAVEENLNLASQWNALGISQRDLFKKLRNRWQADRDAWETRLLEAEEVIVARESRIAQLTGVLEGAGKDIPTEVVLDEDLRREIRELKLELDRRDEEIARLESEADDVESIAKILPGLPEAPPVETSEADSKRFQELEQDLIDTHDELHRVREDSLKQEELIESLEAKLINSESGSALQEAEARITDLEKQLASDHTLPSTVAAPQFQALLSQRSNELLGFRDQIRKLKAEKLRLSGGSAEASAAEDRFETLQKEFQAASKRIEELEGELARSEEAQEAMQAKLEQAETLDKRRKSLQADLNDAQHELYDVRRAFNEKRETVAGLEAALEEARSDQSVKEAFEKELQGVRKELSDAKMALAEKVKAVAEGAAQMEELEAIIEDRSAEVQDLSSEVRQQRDQIRALKDTLATTQGELEAINEESTYYERSIAAKQTFVDEQAQRITELEEALAERYRELNEVRSGLDEARMTARNEGSRAEHLQSELDRRTAEFDASDSRIASFEEEIENARATIEELTAKLTASDQSIEQLREEVRSLSHDKDEVLRELEQANRRVEQLTEAKSEREARIDEIETAWRESSRNEQDFERKVERLTAEIEQATQGRKEAEEIIAALEGNLRESDARTLELSNQVDRRDAELGELKASVAQLEDQLGRRDSEITEAQRVASNLQSDLQHKLEIASTENATLESAKRALGSPDTPDIASLRARIEAQEKTIAQYVEQRRQSVEEIERLRSKVAKRGDSIRELQSEISNIMMQRAARDNEISLLKDKLRAVEKELAQIHRTGKASSPEALQDLEAAIQSTLLTEQAAGATGTSLDDLQADTSGHHTLAGEERGSATEEAGEAQVDDDDNTVYFDENSSSLTDVAVGRIDEFARTVRRSGRKLSVSVIGFSGQEGSADYNESLSAKRADAVRERLLERGVPQSLVTVESSGQDRRFSNWRARRVELVPVPNAVAETIN